MSIKKLNAKGFSHHAILVAFVVIFAVAGVGYLVASHAASKPHNYHCTRKVLKVGSTGSCVGFIQFLTRQETGKPKKIDGEFGPKTKDGVIRFQKLVHLRPADGVVGPRTWEKVCLVVKTTRSNVIRYELDGKLGC